jgi:hypothetical protein
MKLKLARTTLKAKPKTIELKKLEEELANRSIITNISMKCIS